MSNKQETLIYIEKEEADEANFMSRTFINKEVKNRAYINTLGAELVMKFLSSEGIEVKDLHSMHSISKVLEHLDIADIILPKIHIDVRTVFDKKQIFIPKSHFELGITPNIYVVLVLDQDFRYCELAGFFTPDMIDKKDENSQYYFISPDKLYSPETLVKYVKDFAGDFSKNLSQDEIFRGRELFVMLSDHNITENQTKELLNLLIASSVLRESVIEYDNFETLAHNTVLETDLTALTPVFELPKEEVKEEELLETSQDEFETVTDFDFDADSDTDSDGDVDADTDTDSDADSDSDTEEVNSTEDVLTLDDINTLDSTEETLALDDSFLDDLTQAVEENETLKEELKPVEEEEEKHVFELDSADSETLSQENEPDNFDMNIDELPVEPIGLSEDLTLDLDSTHPVEPIEEVKGLDIAEAAKDAVETIGETVGTIAAGATAAAAGAEIAAGVGAAEEVIKLAGVSGEVLENLLDKNAESQQENLNKIDYTNINVNAEEIPEEISAIIAPQTDTSTSEEYDVPMDLSELKTIDTPSNTDEKFEHETIDFHEMETTVEAEKFVEHTDDVVNFDNINFDSPTKPADNLSELITHEEEEGMDLPDVSTFNLEDIESNDDLMSEQSALDEEHLEDMPQNDNQILDDLSLDDLVEEKEESPSIEDFEDVSIDDFSELDDIPSEEHVEVEVEPQEEFQEEPVFEDEISEIQDDEVSEPDLDEEFATDLNTEINADETLHDSEPIKDLENEVIVDNPDEQPRAVIENSTVISDKTFAVGEIPIDINMVNEPQFSNNEPLGSIYNQDSEIDSSMLQMPGRTGKNQGRGKAGLGILGGLVTLIIVCAIGFGVAKMFKAPTEETPEPTTDDALPTDTVDTQAPSADTLNVNTDNVVKMDNNTDALASTNTTTPVVKPTQTAPSAQQAAPVNASAAKKQMAATSFLEVRKLTWEIPDYIAYNPQFKQYFQAAGKSLKLSLTTDLLLAKDFSYTNEIKVTTTFNKDGSFKEARILKSSGSSQIDRIVLQTVNQTLKVLKAPAGVGNDESTTAILKIYF